MAQKLSDTFWLKLHKEYEGGDLTKRAFAAKHQVNFHTLYKRFQRIENRASGKRSSRPRKKSPTFVPLEVTSAETLPPSPASPVLMVVMGTRPDQVAALVAALQSKLPSC